MDEWKKVINLPHKKCFGCGPANTVGLKLEFESNGSILRTYTIIPERLAGWEKLAHGGVLATVLDETMAWTAIYLKRSFILTKNMKVEFLKPVFIGDRIQCEGKIIAEQNQTDESHGKVKNDVIVEARIMNQKDEVLARGEGTIALFDGRAIRKFGFLDEDFLTEFESIVLNQ